MNDIHPRAPLITVCCKGNDPPDFVIDTSPQGLRPERASGQIQIRGAISCYQSEAMKVAVLGRFLDRERFAVSVSHIGNCDAAAVAHAYEVHGPDVFRKLDDVSILLFDCSRGVLYLFRGWPGTHSFYFAAGNGAFVAANRRSLMAHFQVRMSELETGWGLKLHMKNREVELKQYRTIAVRRSRISFEAARKQLRVLVSDAVDHCRVPNECALLLSGGVDSTILAYVLKSHRIPFKAYTVSLRKPLFQVKTEEFDLYAARRVAEFLHIPLHEVLLDEDELAAGIEDTIRYAETPRSTLVDEMCGLQFVARKFSTLNLAAVYSGEGADCILGGLQFALRFVHPQDLPDYTRRRAEVQLPAGLTVLQKVFHAVAGLDVILPYCSRPLATYALSLPVEYRIDRKRLMKPALRSAFEGEIPKEFLFRAKGITRETTHMRYALEKRFGENKYRYFPLFKKLVRLSGLA